MPRATVHPFPMNQCVVWTDWSTFPLVMQDVDSITRGWTALWVNLRYTSAPFVFIAKKINCTYLFRIKKQLGFFSGLYGLCLYSKQFYVCSDDGEQDERSSRNYNHFSDVIYRNIQSNERYSHAKRLPGNLSRRLQADLGRCSVAIYRHADDVYHRLTDTNSDFKVKSKTLQLTM